MTSPSCDWVGERLTWFVGGELGRDEAHVVADHLARCLPCRREAAGLQQARKALVGLADESLPGVDEAMFTRLHEDTVAAVERVASQPRRGRWGRGLGLGGQLPMAARVLWAAAAGLLFWLGWWSVSEPAASSLLDRDPIPFATGAAGGEPNGNAGGSRGDLAVPWAGPRATMRPLGQTERWSNELEVEAPAGSGMMGRWQLRSLEGFDGPPDPLEPPMPPPGVDQPEFPAESRPGAESEPESAGGGPASEPAGGPEGAPQVPTGRGSGGDR